MNQDSKRLASHKGLPSEDKIVWRAEFLSALRIVEPITTNDGTFYLERGNRKIGSHSKYYDSIFVWNLPAVVTCPGASEWCMSYCYNADPRKDVFPIDKWARNWGAFINDPSRLKEEIIQEIDGVAGKVGVRVHSSGDFFSVEYIAFWTDIVRHLQNTDFWAYTRSWTASSLLPALQELQKLDNIELFASWDESMREPPEGWRRSIVISSRAEILTRGIICPEQTGAVENCANCRYCMTKGKGDVFFIIY